MVIDLQKSRDEPVYIFPRVEFFGRLERTGTRE